MLIYTLFLFKVNGGILTKKGTRFLSLNSMEVLNSLTGLQSLKAKTVNMGILIRKVKW